MMTLTSSGGLYADRRWHRCAWGSLRLLCRHRHGSAVPRSIAAMTHSGVSGGMTRPSRRRAILIAGPTASGKSGLALRLAERVGGVVINADSMQVYRELRHPDGAADARGRGAGAACALRLRQRRGGLFGRALCGRCGPGDRRGARAAAACRSSSAAPGSTSRRCWKACRRCRPIDPDVRAHWRAQAAQRPAAGAACDPGAARSGDGGAADADRPPAHRARARGAGEHRPVARRLAARAGPAGARRGRDGAPAGAAGSRRSRLQIIDARFDAMLAAGALEEVRRCLRSASRTSCRSCGRWGWRRWRRTSPASWDADEAVAAGQGGDAAIRQAAAHLAQDAI